MSDATPAPPTNRRRFLAVAALPVAAAGTTLADEVGRAGSGPLLAAARDYGRLVPGWTAAAEAVVRSPLDDSARRRFASVDREYDSAKRQLLRLMRQAGTPVVADRDAGCLYVDCSPAGSHEDIDRRLPDHAVVRVVPLGGASQGI